jgi:hypothetical protein
MLKQLFLLSVMSVLILAASSVIAQTPAELESKFGTPVNAYVIRPGLLLMTNYTATGQPCEMSIIEAQTPRSNSNSRVPLTAEVVPKLIDELIPHGERGKKTRAYGLIRGQLTTGQFSYDYENVSIELIQNFKPSEGWSDNSLKIKWNNRICK